MNRFRRQRPDRFEQPPQPRQPQSQQSQQSRPQHSARPERPAQSAAAPAPRKLGSLRTQLLRWLLLPLLLLAGLDAVSVYRSAIEAADLAYDRSLLASTRALAERVSMLNGRVVAQVPYVALDSFEADTLGRIYYRVTGIDGEFVSGYDDLPPLPAGVARSEVYPALVYFYNAQYRNDTVRIAALYQPVYDDSMRGIAMIQVGESYEGRRELTRKILLDTLRRQAALICAVAVLTWFAVRFVLSPLMQLRQDVERRAPTDLSGFDPAQVHREVRPLVEAMNGYMERLQALITGQRRFIADASHQLRTPLTVLKTQAQLALRENDPHAMRAIVESIARTTDSTVHLANRLLTLARAEHGLALADMTELSLVEVARDTCLELAQEAVRKQIDLSFEHDGEARLHGSPLLLHELIANLVDNAIRYTPAGGRVALRVGMEDGEALLEISDSGPGIPAAERERVFQPFYRCASAQQVNAGGAGLGMTIVRDIAASHQASVSLDDADGGGLRVRLRFPAARTG